MTETSAVTKNFSSATSYLKAFELFEQNGFKSDPGWLRQLRKTAIDSFVSLGFPTMLSENWRYTNLTQLTQTQFQLSGRPSNLSFDDIKSFLFGKEDWPRLVFINGIFYEQLSFIKKESGIVIQNLQTALTENSEIVKQHLNRYADFKQNAFTALNTAFFHDGAFIHLTKGKVLKEPVHLLFISTSSEPKVQLNSYRNLIVLEENAQASIIDNYGSISDGQYFNNSVTEIILQKGAQAQYHKLERESQNSFHIGMTQVNQIESTKFFSSAITLDGGLVRNGLNVILNGEHSECELNGLYMISGNEHVDNYTLIDHPKPNAKSRQVYKGILAGKSTAVFSGKVFVHENAQKTDASQTNKNLLLSKHATVNTKPQLEIFADDVKCTHGAAVGQLEDEAIFYLKTRGIDERSASRLLSYGFAGEVIDTIQIEPVKQELNRILSEKLDGDLAN